LQAVEEGGGAPGVHGIGGEAGEDVSDGGLDGGAVLNAVDGEGFGGKDGDHVAGVVVAAVVLVLHSEGTAAVAVAVDVDAPVRLGGMLAEFGIEGHEGTCGSC
jgi:hypothetical protein